MMHENLKKKKKKKKESDETYQRKSVVLAKQKIFRAGFSRKVKNLRESYQSDSELGKIEITL